MNKSNMQQIRSYRKAPLPFQGQKRRWLSELRQLAFTFPAGATVVDLFGGSGICAHTVLQFRPDLHVIWNDYDDYQHRLDLIPETNAHLAELRRIIGDLPRGQVIRKDTPAHRDILAHISEAERTGADMQSIMAWLTYSSDDKSVASPTAHLYNRLPSQPYNAEGYLVGVERVSLDYRELLGQVPQDVILIVDPPYLSTSALRYAQREEGKFWGLTDHLRLLSLLKGYAYIYFSSSKSEVLELDALTQELIGTGYLGTYQHICKGTKMSHNCTGYTDYLVTNINL